jgi:hypothetical protein
MASVSRAERFGPLSGVVFVILYLVGLFLIELPGGGDDNADVAATYGDHGNRVQAWIGIYAWAFAGLFFLLFLGLLWGRLRRAQQDIERLSHVALASGVIFVAMLFAAGAAVAAMVGAYSIGHESHAGADLARFGELSDSLLLVYGMFAAAGLIAASSFVTLQTGAFPLWVGWFGFICAACLVVGILWVTQFVFLLWVAIVSLLLFRSAGWRVMARPSGLAHKL